MDNIQEVDHPYKTVFDVIPLGVILHEPDGVIIAANPAAQRALGLSHEELTGKTSLDPHWRCIHEDGSSFPGEDHPIMEVLRTKQGVRDVVMGVFIPKINGYHWINISATPHFIKLGEPPAMVIVTFEDITARKQAEDQLRTSQHMLQLFVEFAPAAIAMFDRDMNYLAVSQRFLSDYRLLDQNVIGRSHYDIFPEIPERWKEIHRRCLAGGIEKTEEDPFPRGDGMLDWIRWEIHPWFINPGEVGGILLFSEVITEQVRARQKIVQLSRLYATLSQINLAIVRAKTRQELFETVCAVAVEYGKFSLAMIGLYDLGTGQVTFAATSDLLPFNEINVHSAPFEQGLAGRALLTGQMAFSADLQSDPTMQHWHTAAVERGYHSAATVPLCLSGQVIGMMGLFASEKDFFVAEEEQKLLDEIGLDISFALDQMESEKIKRQWADAFEHCAHGIAIGDPISNHIITCNPAFARLQGRTVEELRAVPAISTYQAGERSRVKELVAQADRTGSASFEAHRIRKDGTSYAVQMDLVSASDANGKLLYRVATEQDITERIRTHEILRQSEEKFSTAFRTSPDSMTITRISDGLYLAANEGFTRLLGYAPEEVIGKTVFELSIWGNPIDRSRFIEELQATGEVNNLVGHFRRKDGSIVVAWVSARPLEVNG